MKEITCFTDMDQEKREATELEVQLLSALRHPNVVAYQDSFVNREGHLCIFMEYCEHGDVHTFLQAAKRPGHALLGEMKSLEWFVQITLALQALHAKRIIHRDMKTQNIFLSGCGASSPEFAVKLGDLGVAKVLNSAESLAMTQIGTPYYMSPELFNNKPYGCKSDVWSLGCVLYELVNGHLAFEGQSLNGLALKIIKAQYTPIKAQSCSDEVKALIHSLLSTNPAHRPALQEILHFPAVRRRLPAALQAAICSAEAYGQEAGAQAEAVFTEQLASLGLHGGSGPRTGGAGGAGFFSGAPMASHRKDKRSFQQKLERAERRMRREEETLRRLQETAGMLGLYLQPQDAGFERSPYIPPVREYGGGAPPQGVRPLALASVQASNSTANLDAPPALSHRDKVLLRKERRREEEQQRFEGEAKKIREENLAFQRAWVSGSKELANNGSHTAQSHSLQHAQLQQQPVAQQRKHAIEHLSPLTPLLDYKHITPANLANPFQSCRQKVVHTPAVTEVRRHHGAPERERGVERGNVEPPVPLVQYSDPAPPHQASHVGRWTAGSSGGFSRATRAPRRVLRSSHSLRSVSLNSLSERHPMPNNFEDSEDLSGSEASGGDGGSPSGDDNARLREESQVVQQRIDDCCAAIYRHRMTIDMLHGVVSCAPDSEGAVPPLPLAQWSGDEALLEEAPSRSQSKRPPAVPALVQDRVVRLRRRCVELLGDTRFEEVRRSLKVLKTDGARSMQARERMLEMLGQNLIGLHALLDQIVHMELSWWPGRDF
ncbi:unnamed protein product [Polarella glacialis]|uniref:non-specific serine/threonine protein kinase n=1 Tax=Polarella glacialis TaxID=89957 RepID=A0A813GUP9_POLGL|nr:unnamed protein product [Polarella glacialis]